MSEMMIRVGAAILLAEARWNPEAAKEPKERVMARAAIEAMREPTRDMLAAVGRVSSGQQSGWVEYYDPSLGEKLYLAMIDAALASNEPQAG